MGMVVETRRKVLRLRLLVSTPPSSFVLDTKGIVFVILTRGHHHIGRGDQHGPSSRTSAGWLRCPPSVLSSRAKPVTIELERDRTQLKALGSTVGYGAHGHVDS